jgi:hypothetical protein
MDRPQAEHQLGDAQQQPGPASASGARCARTTARTAERGATCRTTTPVRGRTGGRGRAGGFSDPEQRLCLALALRNGRDPILKERPFGLTGPEGNYGEDAKDYWRYLDAVPSHAWNRWRYHYPQVAFPYADLVAENGRRGRHDPEYELLDTGVLDKDRYWIVERRLPGSPVRQRSWVSTAAPNERSTS